MTLVAWLLFTFGLARLVVSGYNRLSAPFLPRTRPRRAVRPEVSVLIPARNEERNIGRLLGDLAKADAGIREILVYDDRSTDATARLVERFARANPRIRCIAGGDLPAGWQGKNYACHRLATEAAGAYLLFLDADVRIRGQAVVRALRCMQRSGVDLLSVFPRQLMPDAGTRLCVPLMNWILLSLLPLDAVARSPHASLSAANGQFLLFEASTYRALQPHRRFRASPVEDIAIARGYKRCGRRIAVLLGRGEVACTMYRGLDEAVDGFARNFFAFFGGSEPLSYLFVLATTAAPFVVFLALGSAAGAAYLLVIVLIRWFTSTASRQSPGMNILRMIPQQIVLWRIVWTASVRKRKRSLLWKGRNIYRNCG